MLRHSEISSREEESRCGSSASSPISSASSSQPSRAAVDLIAYLAPHGHRASTARLRVPERPSGARPLRPAGHSTTTDQISHQTDQHLRLAHSYSEVSQIALVHPGNGTINDGLDPDVLADTMKLHITTMVLERHGRLGAR